MEIVVPVPAMEFQFDSSCSTPYTSAPSSPRRAFGNFYFSAPTSPTRATAIYSEFKNHSNVIPYDWEEKPGRPKSKDDDDDGDFEFEFSARFADPEKPPLLQSTADELFYDGKIRPLKPPPRLQQLSISSNQKSSGSPPCSSSSSPRSPIAQGRKMIREAFSPRSRPKRDFDPFMAAVEETRKQEEERGRERSDCGGSNRRRTRSLSPLRIFNFSWDEQQQDHNPSNKSSSSVAAAVPPKPPPSVTSSKSNSSPSSRKWRLKDFLFRSASEGRAEGKDPLSKLKKSNLDDVKNSSFRSTGSSGSGSGSSRGGRRAPPVSPHELHYTANRAVSEELRKKTFLPYKQGLLGCLGFNPIISSGFKSAFTD